MDSAEILSRSVEVSVQSCELLSLFCVAVMEALLLLM